MDVNAYAIANLAFPHESTADQWYSESQFESYRRLGQFLTASLGEGRYEQDGPGEKMAAFFEDLRGRALATAEKAGMSVGAAEGASKSA
jgi:hypothetical protein